MPSWSREDLDFFLHGSMSTEFVPEAVLKAFIRVYPDIFPKSDLSHLGLIPDPAFGWPVGFSRKGVEHLSGLSLGVNCASCHVGEIETPGGGPPVRVLGMTGHFDAETFFGSVILATFRTADPANMTKFLAEYTSRSEGPGDVRTPGFFEQQWKRQEQQILPAISADPSGSRGIAPGALHQIDDDKLRFSLQKPASTDLTSIAHEMLKLFHNIRAALHVPDQPPDKQPPASGPGRNDAFGLLSATLFGAPQPLAPVKYGLVWNLENRRWVHADGNTQSPLGRNLLASLGLGAPANAASSISRS